MNLFGVKSLGIFVDSVLSCESALRFCFQDSLQTHTMTVLALLMFALVASMVTPTNCDMVPPVIEMLPSSTAPWWDPMPNTLTNFQVLSMPLQSMTQWCSIAPGQHACGCANRAPEPATTRRAGGPTPAHHRGAGVGWDPLVGWGGTPWWATTHGGLQP